jgi:hypothetical protein
MVVAQTEDSQTRMRVLAELDCLCHHTRIHASKESRKLVD